MAFRGTPGSNVGHGFRFVRHPFGYLEPRPHFIFYASTLIFAKKTKPESISGGRPITILGFLARLTSKLVADQVLKQWTATWPPEISGGLPHRSARDLSLVQLLQVDPSHSMVWLDNGPIVKAFNLIPRRVVRHVFCLLGIPHYISDFWFKSLKKLSKVWHSHWSCGPFDYRSSSRGFDVCCRNSSAKLRFPPSPPTPKAFPICTRDADNWSFMATSERESGHD